LQEPEHGLALERRDDDPEYEDRHRARDYHQALKLAPQLDQRRGRAHICRLRRLVERDPPTEEAADEPDAGQYVQ
jgi:hypothetical protein